MTITGAPAAVEVTEGPKHKKNPAVGNKKILKLNKVGSRGLGVKVSGCKVCVQGFGRDLMWLWCIEMRQRGSCKVRVVGSERHAICDSACADCWYKCCCWCDNWLLLTDMLLPRLLMLPQVWLDQADGQVLSEGEEVTFMDWGNAFIRVSPAGSGGCYACCFVCCCMDRLAGESAS